MAKARYRTHRFPVGDDGWEDELEIFLNGLEGEVISLLPVIKKLSLPQIYGVTKRVDHLLIVEKIEI